MQELNFHPFYIGQRVVALKSKGNPYGISIKEGVVYVVKNTMQCKCGKWKIDIGLPSSDPSRGVNTCAYCHHRYATHDGVSWVGAALLAPIEENFQSISLEKILEKETPLVSVN